MCIWFFQCLILASPIGFHKAGILFQIPVDQSHMQHMVRNPRSYWAIYLFLYLFFNTPNSVLQNIVTHLSQKIYIYIYIAFSFLKKTLFHIEFEALLFTSKITLHILTFILYMHIGRFFGNSDSFYYYDKYYILTTILHKIFWWYFFLNI